MSSRNAGSPRCSADDKVFCKVDAPDQISGCDERFVGFGVDTGDDGLDKVRSKSFLVEG